MFGFLRRKTDFFSVDAARARDAVTSALSRQLARVGRDAAAAAEERAQNAARDAERKAGAASKAAAQSAAREAEEAARKERVAKAKAEAEAALKAKRQEDEAKARGKAKGAIPAACDSARAASGASPLPRVSDPPPPLARALVCDPCCVRRRSRRVWGLASPSCV